MLSRTPIVKLLAVVAALVALAVVVPTASARPIIPLTDHAQPATGTHDGSGFDWGAAGIGAAVLLAVAAAGGGVALVSRRRQAAHA